MLAPATIPEHLTKQPAARPLLHFDALDSGGRLKLSAVLLRRSMIDMPNIIGCS